MEYYEGRLSFIVQWYDEQAALIRSFILNFFEDDCSFELLKNEKARKKFLHRTKVEGVCRESLIIGNFINVFGRSLEIVDYADVKTSKLLHSHTERAILVILPEVFDKVWQVMEAVQRECFKIRKLQSFVLSSHQAEELLKDFEEDMKYRDYFVSMANKPLVVMLLSRKNAMRHLMELVGDIDPHVARNQNPSSLRAQYGIDRVKNAFYTCTTHAHVKRDLAFFFERTTPSCFKLSSDYYKDRVNKLIHGTKTDPGLETTVTYVDSSCVLIKPHAFQQGQASKIIEKLMAGGFEVTAYQMCHMEKINAEEFYEVYRGVLVEYPQMVAELSTGPCLALEVKYRKDGRGVEEDVGVEVPKKDGKVCLEETENGAKKRGKEYWDKRHMLLRNYIGPPDPEMARHIRPTSLRAIFGKDRIHNSIHVTDLPEDCVPELEYFFRLMSGL